MANYKYWEQFVHDWINGTLCHNMNIPKFCGWKNPDSVPLLNKRPNDLSSNYLPEPWWGNDGTRPLHSVVINFNPGEGGKEQERCKFNCGCSYSKDVVGNFDILPNTRRWHKSRRAMRVLNTLYRNNFINKPYGLENHLSVELIPWHTQYADDTYIKYLKQNIKAVYENSICFAANESKRIENDKLNSVVIIRMSDSKTKLVLDELKLQLGVCNNILKCGVTTSKKGNYMSFQISSLPNIKFVSIWATRWNDFPPNSDMDEIFRIVI